MPPCVSAWKIRHWYAKRKSYRVLFWREITPLAVPIFLENACVLLMGVLSTFLVSWLGKEAMAGVGLADSFNMVIIAFFAAVDLGTTVVVAFSLGKRDRRRARARRRVSPGLDDRRGAAVGGRHSSGGRIDHRCDRRGGLAGGEGAGAFLPADHGVELSGGGDCADWQRHCAARATPRSRC